MSVTTRTAAEAVGTRLTFDHEGHITTRSAVAREVETFEYVSLFD